MSPPADRQGSPPAPAAGWLTESNGDWNASLYTGDLRADFVHIGGCRRGMPWPAHHDGQHQPLPIGTTHTSRERGDERSGVDKGLERGLAHHDRDRRLIEKGPSGKGSGDSTDVCDHRLLGGIRGASHVAPQMLDGTGLRRAKETRDDSDAAGQPLCVTTQQAARG